MEQTTERKARIAIVGPANVGKSILFNKFSKAYSIVSNYAHTTFEAVRREADFAGRSWEIIDTPGMFSLNVFTDDERVTRDVLLRERPELVIFCADASRLKNSLIVYAQIQELHLPVVFCLNKMDIASKKGITVDEEALSRQLNTPVVKTAAEYGIGLKEIEHASATVTPSVPNIPYPSFVEEGLERLEELFPPGRRPARGELLMLLGGNDWMAERIDREYPPAVAEPVRNELKTRHRHIFPAAFNRAIMNAREKWASQAYAASVASSLITSGKLSELGARLSRHPIWGWPILMGVLWLVFFLVGDVAGRIATWLDEWFFIPLTDLIADLVPGAFMQEMLVGDFGLLTMGVFNAVGTVVPILLLFFLIINLLEDIGYLPNLGVLLNRMLSPLGLSGKAVLPMVLGFGCNTMATLTTRMLETPRERFIASFLIALGFPCAVQLGVMLAILATAPFSALLFVIMAVAGTQILTGLALNRLVPDRKKSDFMVELPPFRLPHWKNVMVKTYYRLKWFLVEALPMFVVAAGALFAMEKTGLLTMVRHAFRPVVAGFLSLPDKATEMFILVLSRREIGAVYFKDMVDAGEVGYVQIIVGLTVMTLFIPCASNTMVMIKELGFSKAVFINVFIIVLAILVGGALNFALRAV